MFELLTRQLPFQDIGHFELEKEVVQKRRRPNIPAYCPPGIKFYSLMIFLEYKKLMTACWHYDPDKRPSAEKLTADLTLLARGASQINLVRTELRTSNSGMFSIFRFVWFHYEVAPFIKIAI